MIFFLLFCAQPAWAYKTPINSTKPGPEYNVSTTNKKEKGSLSPLDPTIHGTVQTFQFTVENLPYLTEKNKH